MTQFNPENKDIITYGEALKPAMEITDQADADQYKAAYIAYQEKHITNGRSESGMSAEQMVNVNLGYFAGYYSDEVRSRVERLFKCSHPIFGSIDNNGVPSIQEALKCGREQKTLDEIRNMETLEKGNVPQKSTDEKLLSLHEQKESILKILHNMRQEEATLLTMAGKSFEWKTLSDYLLS